MDYFTQNHIDPMLLKNNLAIFGTGLAASRGVITAPIAYTTTDCMEQAIHGDVILCLRDCIPADARAIRAAAGLIMIEGFFMCLLYYIY